MLMPHRSYASTANYRFGFNGKENDNEPKGLGNQQDYGMRVFDPRLGKFLSIDPLSHSYPWLSTYQYAENMPIWAIDLDGAESFKVTQRSFAPWHRFGDVLGYQQKSFIGDNRGFSLRESSSQWELNKATARLHSMAGFTLGINGTNPSSTSHFSSITRGYPNFKATGRLKEEEAYAHPSGTESFINNKLTLQVEGSDPLVTIAPDIDWKCELQFNLQSKSNLFIEGFIQGKGFPAYENFIEDEAGKKVFLHTYASPDRLKLSDKLMKFKYDYKAKLYFNFELDSKGNFTGKMWIGSEGKEVTEKLITGKTLKFKPINWVETTIDKWNQANLTKEAAPDLKEKQK